MKIGHALSYDDASAHCKRLGRNLTTVGSEDEVIVMNAYLRFGFDYWIGLRRDPTNDTNFLWEDGSPLTYFQPWAEDVNDGDCVVQNWYNKWYLDDCDVERYFWCGPGEKVELTGAPVPQPTASTTPYPSQSPLVRQPCDDFYYYMSLKHNNGSRVISKNITGSWEKCRELCKLHKGVQYHEKAQCNAWSYHNNVTWVDEWDRGACYLLTYPGKYPETPVFKFNWVTGHCDDEPWPLVPPEPEPPWLPYMECTTERDIARHLPGARIGNYTRNETYFLDDFDVLPSEKDCAERCKWHQVKLIKLKILIL